MCQNVWGVVGSVIITCYCRFTVPAKDFCKPVSSWCGWWSYETRWRTFLDHPVCSGRCLIISVGLQRQGRAERHNRCWCLACKETLRVCISSRLRRTAERFWPHVFPGAGWHDHYCWNAAVLQVWLSLISAGRVTSCRIATVNCCTGSCSLLDSCPFIVRQVRKVLWTRKGVHATVVTAGHCTHVELPLLAVTAVACTPAVSAN